MIAAAQVAPLLRGFGAVAPLVAPRLSVADNGDGSGASASVTGSGPGSTNTIYVEALAGELVAGEWTGAGAVPGDGNVSLALPAGHYFAYAASSITGDLAFSNVVYFAVSDGALSTYARCLAAVQARIRLLALGGVDSQNVIIGKVPAARGVSGGGFELPAILLTPQRAAMPATSGNNVMDDVHYDVLVTMLDRDNQEPTLRANLDRHLLWRQQIARAFRNQRLSGVNEVINAEVEPGEAMLDDAWKRELMASAVLLRFTSRETRGI